MGGFGSGWRALRLARPVVDDFLKLDVNRQHRRGDLNGAWRVIAWTCGGEPAGSIEFRMVNPNTAELSFVRCVDDGPPTPVTQRVLLSRTACHFGGTRPWWRCPSCWRRVGSLYRHDWFVCRHCLGVGYASQREGERRRALRTARRIRERLDGSLNLDWAFPPKPRGMHWQTYRRLRATGEDAEARSL